MSEIVYRLRGVMQCYGPREVLRIDELEIERGEILAVVGPNGAGKSSLLRLLNFIEAPSAGQMLFEGRAVAGKAALALRRRVTTVFQRPILLTGSVQANVSYGLKVRREKDIEERTLRAMDRVGLSALAHASAKTLSGGEAQRVALARAMAIEPDVLLLDEPTANLDPYNGALIERIASELNRERGTTMVIVTHNVFQARRLAHRVMLLLGGRAVEVGPTEQFFSAPVDARTAAFVRGDMVY
jgi:tungstate transport system ATP-binding protein